MLTGTLGHCVPLVGCGPHTNGVGVGTTGVGVGTGLGVGVGVGCGVGVVTGVGVGRGVAVGVGQSELGCTVRLPPFCDVPCQSNVPLELLMRKVTVPVAGALPVSVRIVPNVVL